MKDEEVDTQQMVMIQVHDGSVYPAIPRKRVEPNVWEFEYLSGPIDGDKVRINLASYE